jgi:uncharacterized protein
MSDGLEVQSVGEITKDEMQWGMFAHLSTFAGYVIPFGNLLGPFVIWQMRKDEQPFVADQAKEALNFQITVTLAAVASLFLACFLVGYVLLPLVGIADLVLTMMAAMAANKGELYRYPLTLRLVP